MLGAIDLGILPAPIAEDLAADLAVDRPPSRESLCKQMNDPADYVKEK